MEGTKSEVLWEQKSNAPLNIWGIKTGNTKLNNTVQGGFLGGEMMYDGHFGPLAQFFIFGLITYLAITFFLSVYPVRTTFFVLLINSYIVYRFFIRELKYYKLAKTTIYQITNKEIIIKYFFFGFKKIVHIDLKEISYLHEVEYQYGLETKGSIWIYHSSDVKVYDIVKKERTVLPRIQMVQNHKEALSLLNKLISNNKR